MNASGLLLIDKPEGPTSHDAVAAVRQQSDIRRVGHAGTLDPFASGLLLLLVGRATRLNRFLVGLPKRYTGVIALGAITDTDDRTGRVITATESWKSLSAGALQKAAHALTGRYRQRPPAYSAKKVLGERAYRMARRGHMPDLAPTPVEVFGFAVGEPRDGRVGFEVSVSSGTYVRALARDLGERLGCGAYLDALRRTAIGPFEVDDAISFDELGDGPLPLRPLLEAVAHLPRVQVAGAERDRVAHGHAISAAVAGQGPVAVVDDDELIAIAEPHDGQLQPRVVLRG